MKVLMRVTERQPVSYELFAALARLYPQPELALFGRYPRLFSGLLGRELDFQYSGSSYPLYILPHSLLSLKL
jgi:hypothetical protein